VCTFRRSSSILIAGRWPAGYELVWYTTIVPNHGAINSTYQAFHDGVGLSIANFNHVALASLHHVGALCLLQVSMVLDAHGGVNGAELLCTCGRSERSAEERNGCDEGSGELHDDYGEPVAVEYPGSGSWRSLMYRSLCET
jgi:hypothetical protein